MQILRNRISPHRFESGPGLSDDEIHDLIETVTATPSSFNVQHWRFIAVTRSDPKKWLGETTFNQALVNDSAVTFIVLADLRGFDRLEEILSRSVTTGKIGPEVARLWVDLAMRNYANPVRRRDEAIRSGSMAAMALMTAVADKGWASSPMIVLDTMQLKKRFSISDRFLPIMLVAVGRKPGREYARMERLKVEEVLAFNTSHVFEEHTPADRLGQQAGDRRHALPPKSSMRPSLQPVDVHLEPAFDAASESESR